MPLKYNMMRWSVSAKPLNVNEWNPECESTRSKRLSTIKSSAPFYHLPNTTAFSTEYLMNSDINVEKSGEPIYDDRQ